MRGAGAAEIDDNLDSASTATMSKSGSRRGSETTDGGNSATPALVAGAIEQLKLGNVTEGEVLE
jgi:hypothetical protein